ncbi:hypothetical protein AA313_de0203697 [Arthrobotrys entomopaga]|nr:hypothetical protein AA313_de0203697 [Arthrobotrys entomopaga]
MDESKGYGWDESLDTGSAYRRVLDPGPLVQQAQIKRKDKWKVIRHDSEAAQYWEKNFDQLMEFFHHRDQIQWTAVHLGTFGNEATVAMIYDTVVENKLDEEAIASDFRCFRHPFFHN